jgi:hypothetical protein
MVLEEPAKLVKGERFVNRWITESAHLAEEFLDLARGLVDLYRSARPLRG